MFRTYQDKVRTPKIEKKHHEVLANAYNCDLCDKGGWLTPNDVEIHKKNAHGRLIHEYKKHGDRFCTVCMTLHDSYEELVKHLKSQHLLSSPNAQKVERVIYICDECTNIFFNKDVLETHMLSVHLTKKSERKLKFFTCPKCFKTLRLNTMWFHLQSHEIPSVSLCDICLCNCRDQTDLKEHLKSHKRHLKCEPCGYISNISIQFNSHMLQHKKRLFPIQDVHRNVLNSVFKKRKSNFIRYNMHNAIKGLNLPKFVQICTLCREICLSHGEKRRHVLRDHMLEEVEKKKYLCVCGEEFEYKVVLKQHLLKMPASHYAVDERKAVIPIPVDPPAQEQTCLQNERKAVTPIPVDPPAQEQTCLQNEEIKMEVTPAAELTRLKTIKVKKLDLVKIEFEFPNVMNENADAAFASLTAVRTNTSEDNSNN